jgi:adenosine kinase
LFKTRLNLVFGELVLKKMNKNNHMQKRTLVVGSVAIDVLFGLQEKIRDRIVLTGKKLGRQNLMFTANAKEERYGGTGGNIAYGLGLLGVRPILFSAAGRDFTRDFQKHLIRHGVDLRIHLDKRSYTATFYGMSDRVKEQIGVWQPNAHVQMKHASIIDEVGKNDIKNIAVCIFSGKPSLTHPHLKTIRRMLGKRTCIIYDPGKMMTSGRDKTLLLHDLKLSDIFIVNDVELSQVSLLLKRTIAQILALGPKAIIETKGKDGSVIHEKEKTTHVQALKPAKLVEATGAGDAYRAGLMYGILNGLSLHAACRIGSYLGSRNVETLGGQTYRLDKKHFHKFLSKENIKVSKT